MPRPLRSRYPYGWYHVYARGVDGRRIFDDDVDRRSYERDLREVERRHGWRVHCAVQMTTHVHLIVEVGQPGLSRGVQLLHGRYAQRYNLRHGRTGHLFGSRFGARPIRDECQLGRTIEYVLWNPVTAGLVRRPQDWPWTRTRYAIRGGTAPRLPDRAVEILEREQRLVDEAHRLVA